MGVEVTFVLDEDLIQRVRIEIARRGGKKGDLSKAIAEAIQLWLEKKQQNVLNVELWISFKDTISHTTFSK